MDFREALMGVVRAKQAVPAELLKALDAAPAARKAFDALAPSHQREYLKWIGEAKREATRAKRIAETVARLTPQKAGR